MDMRGAFALCNPKHRGSTPRGTPQNFGRNKSGYGKSVCGVQTRTGQQTMDNILRERRLRWRGHVFRMDHQRVPQQALYSQVPGYRRGPGRPRVNWRGVVSKDLRKMGFTWEEAEVAALDRHGWRRSVAQCVQLDTG